MINPHVYIGPGRAKAIWTWLFVLSSTFPYTRILPINSITQPYALAVSILFFLFYFSSIPRLAFRLASPLAVLLGLASFFIVLSLYSGLDFGSLKWYASYLSAYFVFISAFYLLIIDNKNFKIALIVSFIVWFFVGAVQKLFIPTFLTFLTSERHDEAAAALVGSGRGVFGLAHEPTHHAFHLLLIGATLMQFKFKFQPYFLMACIFSILFFSMSSSALLCIFLGLVVYILRSDMFRFFLISLSTIMVFYLLLLFFPEDSRIADLLSLILASPTSLFSIDYSVNMRLGGLVAGIISVLDNFFLPTGLNHSKWISDINLYYDIFPWLFEISEEGWPSGYVLIIYQLGFLAFPLILFIYRVMVAIDSSRFSSAFLAYSGVSIFLFQFYISSPMFGILFASLFYKQLVDLKESSLKNP
jgi:hypothetical protein